MFDLLPENVAKTELDEERARALGRLWQACKPLLTLTAFGFGAVALLIGLSLLGVTLWSRPRGPEVRALSGTVVRLAEKKMVSRDGPDARVYSPVVRFTVDGQEREFTGRLATRPSPWTVGETVPVLYDPVAGRSELIGWKTWAFAAEISAAGAGLLAMGLVLRRRRWWAAPGHSSTR